MRTKPTEPVLPRSAKRVWRWLRWWWLLNAPKPTGHREMPSREFPTSIITWNRYEVLCWLKAVRDGGLRLKDLDPEMQTAVYYEMVEQNEAARQMRRLL